MLRLILTFPPSVNRLWRTSKGGGVYRSPKYAQWRNVSLWQLQTQARGKLVKGEYKLTIRAVRPDKRRRDLDNILKAISDVCESAKVIEGDHLCMWIDARWVDEGPECEVVIEGMADGKTI
jgi:crossover junction endodeoxyribonuclease RusA